MKQEPVKTHLQKIYGILKTFAMMCPILAILGGIYGYSQKMSTAKDATIAASAEHNTTVDIRLGIIEAHMRKADSTEETHNQVQNKKIDDLGQGVAEQKGMLQGIVTMLKKK